MTAAAVLSVLYFNDEWDSLKRRVHEVYVVSAIADSRKGCPYIMYAKNYL